MKMKFFVLGFIFDHSKQDVLLISKNKPKWQKGRWNGIGGKIETDETPLQAMIREDVEETRFSHTWQHAITFTCPGGTVFVFKAVCCDNRIRYTQVEKEYLKVWPVRMLPKLIMNNLKWIIPVCLSTIQFPLIVQQNGLGNE